MNGYIEAGYTVVLGTLAVYGTTLLRREQAARARLGLGRRAMPSSTEDTEGSSAGAAVAAEPAAAEEPAAP